MCEDLEHVVGGSMPQKGPPWMGWTVQGCNPNYEFLVINCNVFLEKNGHRNQNILLQRATIAPLKMVQISTNAL